MKHLGPLGQWKRISPEETLMAWYSAVARDIKAKKDDEILSKWLLVMLTTEGHFMVSETLQSMDWLACQQREDIMQNTTLARTTVQRIFELIHRRKELNITTAKHMQELYAKSLVVSSYSEPITFSFVDMAFTIWDRALSKPAIQEVVLQEEELRTKSIFNSSVRMQLIISKAKTEEMITWCFIMLKDLRSAGLLTPESASTRLLSGTAKDGNKGYVDAMVYKKTFLGYLLDQVLSSKSWSCEIKIKLRDVCSSPSSFRHTLGKARKGHVLPRGAWARSLLGP